MSVQYVTVGFCPQYDSTWSFQASPQRGGSYIVRMYADERMQSTCTCPAFTFFKGEPWDRTCKHLKAVWEHGCFFNPQWRDAGPNDYAQHGITLVDLDMVQEGRVYDTLEGDEPLCPGCGSLMIPVVIAV